MFVRPSLHGKKGPVKFKFLFARYPTLNGGVKDTVELNWMTFEIGNGWNEVKIGHKGMEIESEVMNRRIFALWQCSGSMRQMEHHLAIAQSGYLSHESIFCAIMARKSMSLVSRRRPLAILDDSIMIRLTELMKIGVFSIGIKRGTSDSSRRRRVERNKSKKVKIKANFPFLFFRIFFFLLNSDRGVE